MTPLLLVGLVGQLQDSMTVVRGFSFFMSIDHRSGSVFAHRVPQDSRPSGVTSRLGGCYLL